MPFQSVHSALLYGFRPHAVIQLASVEREFRDKGGQLPGSGLTPMELVADAAMIQNLALGALGDEGRLFIRARFADKPDNIRAVRELTTHIEPLVPSGSKGRMLALLILKYLGAQIKVPDGDRLATILPMILAGHGEMRYGGKRREGDGWEIIPLGTVATMFRLHPNTVTTRWRTIRDYLRPLQDGAEIAVFDALSRGGHIVDQDAA